MWKSIDKALIIFGDDQAKATNRFLKAVRIAINKYAHVVDSENFDELGQPKQ